MHQLLQVEPQPVARRANHHIRAHAGGSRHIPAGITKCDHVGSYPIVTPTCARAASASCWPLVEPQAKSAPPQSKQQLSSQESPVDAKLGSDFCAHNGLIFEQAMALRGATELEPFAAGQPVLPATVDPCPVTQAAQAPVRKAVSTHR